VSLSFWRATTRFSIKHWQNTTEYLGFPAVTCAASAFRRTVPEEACSPKAICPTRPSPVKRGLFILENILGTPSPPAPPNIPELEAAAEGLGANEPTLRELLARHRQDPLCASCHSRIDPLGLAFDNFTAAGSWRDQEHQQTIDASGQLVTGESFEGVQELKSILATQYRMNFYRCLTEKLLTYALGRGLENHDEFTVDQIVAGLDKDSGKIMSLLMGIVESAPFQKSRHIDAIHNGNEDRNIIPSDAVTKEL
jgi:hypothetical protein